MTRSPRRPRPSAPPARYEARPCLGEDTAFINDPMFYFLQIFANCAALSWEACPLNRITPIGHKFLPVQQEECAISHCNILNFSSLRGGTIPTFFPGLVVLDAFCHTKNENYFQNYQN